MPSLSKKILLSLALFSSVSSAAWRSGVNKVLDLEADAKPAGRGGVQLALSAQDDFWGQTPSSLALADRQGIRFSHFKQIADAYLDILSYRIPLQDSLNALGFSLARFAQDGIPKVDANEEVFGDEYRTFSVEEYVLQTAYGHRMEAFRFGGVLHLLYRNYDQKALGIRGDAEATWSDYGAQVGLRMKALTSSAARWESEELEYEEPEVFLGLGYEYPIPYFYGKIALGFDSPSFFGERGRSRTDADEKVLSASIGENTGDWFGLWSMGLEYRGDGGLSLRTGLVEISDWRNPSFGVGFFWDELGSVDYALEQHPDLGRFHRISIGLHW